MLSHEILANWRSKVCKTSIPKKVQTCCNMLFFLAELGSKWNPSDHHMTHMLQTASNSTPPGSVSGCTDTALELATVAPLGGEKKTWHRNRKIPSFNRKIPSFNRKCIFIVDFPPSHLNFFFWGGGGGVTFRTFRPWRKVMKRPLLGL